MRRVWYTLVEASGAPPLSAAAAEAQDCVMLNEDASLVVDFRKAVFAIDSRALAPTVIPSDLSVYDGQQKIDISEDIGMRGSSAKNALVVVVSVQAQRNLERDTKRQKVMQAPDHWMKVLKEERVDVLPVDCNAVKRHLQRELREKIPISEDFIKMIQQYDEQGLCEATFKKLFVLRNDGITIRTLRIVSDAITPVTSGADSVTEDTYHSFWDDLIAKVLREVLRGSFRRNTNASTSSGLYRPDLCFYYAKQNVCVFRGEERPNGEMEAPIKELYEKLIWRYDNAPYVFGYAAVGYQVCLALIRKDSAKSHGATAEVIEHYDLSEIDGRLAFLLALLNLSTLFRPVV